MTKTVQTTVELLGKKFNVRCLESEEKALQQAASFLNQKMKEVEESGKVFGIDRIAVITALNLSYQLLNLDQQKESFMNRINQRILHLQDKLDFFHQKSLQAELIPAE